jgi:cytochrome c biogenesis factor
MFSPQATATALGDTVRTLGTIGRPLEAVVLIAAVILAAIAVVPALRPRLHVALAATTAILVAGEAVLVWFHIRLWQICQVPDFATGRIAGAFAVPLWIESEKLYVWALILALIALGMRRHRAEIRPLLALGVAVLAAGAVLWSHPFTEPLPDFLAQYESYLSAWGSGVAAAMFGAYQAAEGSRLYFYNTWYMWVHPPLLFVSYGAFVTSFAATVLMIVRRRSSFEQTAYRWARLGYLPLTFGMLIGFPWAILAWGGESWWWSGKVNMSIMMWLLYTAYLHARLYLRRRGMWRVVAALAVLSFLALVLTYVTTYLVPGAHSVA